MNVCSSMRSKGGWRCGAEVKLEVKWQKTAFFEEHISKWSEVSVYEAKKFWSEGKVKSADHRCPKGGGTINQMGTNYEIFAQKGPNFLSRPSGARFLMCLWPWRLHTMIYFTLRSTSTGEGVRGRLKEDLEVKWSEVRKKFSKRFRSVVK